MDVSALGQPVDRELSTERAVQLARLVQSPVALSWGDQSLALAPVAGRDRCGSSSQRRTGIALENDVADTAQRGYLNLRAVLTAYSAPLAEREAVWTDARPMPVGSVFAATLRDQGQLYALGRGDCDLARSLSLSTQQLRFALPGTASLCGAFVDLARGGPSRALAR